VSSWAVMAPIFHRMERSRRTAPDTISSRRNPSCLVGTLVFGLAGGEKSQPDGEERTHQKKEDLKKKGAHSKQGSNSPRGNRRRMPYHLLGNKFGGGALLLSS